MSPHRNDAFATWNLLIILFNPNPSSFFFCCVWCLTCLGCVCGGWRGSRRLIIVCAHIECDWSMIWFQTESWRTPCGLTNIHSLGWSFIATYNGYFLRPSHMFVISLSAYLSSGHFFILRLFTSQLMDGPPSMDILVVDPTLGLLTSICSSG